MLSFRHSSPEVDPGAVPGLEADGHRVLDVREEWEFEAGHISSSINLPLGDLPERITELSLDVPWIVVCRSGSRSSTAAGFLASQGLRATNLRGGLGAWRRDGLPLVDNRGGAGVLR